MSTEDERDEQTFSRSIFMTKEASMAWLELQGVNGRKFVVNENAMRHIIFPEHMIKADGQMSEVSNLLRRIHLQKIFIQVGTKNTFPFPIGIRIQGFPMTEFSASGDAYSFILPANTEPSNPILIFESHGDEKLQQTWENDYKKWNMTNLDTLLAMRVPDSDVMLVHNDHPVLQILERRQDLFGVSAAQFTASSTPNWKHIQQSAFDAGSMWIKSNILNKSSRTFDMSQLTVTFSKIDNSKFTDLSPGVFANMNFDDIETPTAEGLNELKSQFANVIMQRPFLLDLKLGFRYRINPDDHQ